MAGQYYGGQLLRSSGSAVLNFGEAQGTTTARNFVSKAENKPFRIKRISSQPKSTQGSRLWRKGIKELVIGGSRTTHQNNCHDY